MGLTGEFLPCLVVGAVVRQARPGAGSVIIQDVHGASLLLL